MAEPKRPNSLVFNEAMLKGFINGTLEPAVEEKIASLLEARPDLLENISAKSGDGFLKRLREVQQRSVEKSPAPIKAEVVATAPIKKSPTKSDSSIPEALANYAGYKIVKELGRGGMGVVYLAKNIQMDRLEVLKVLNERLLDHDGAKERFLREIRAVSKLNHSNIVTSYSILSLEGQLVFAMEYVHGTDLHKYIHKNQPLPVATCCSLAKQLAAGLQHAHSRGLVHRDIKPSNAIVYRSENQLLVKILDFGLAKATSEKKLTGLTQDGTMLGTPEYMSPEQTLDAAKADIRADIYSLGCTLYHMLTGKPPFTGTHGAILIAHAQREPTPLNLVRPDVSTQLAAVVAKMMAKSPDKRYQTPAEASDALTPFLQQLGQPSTPVELASTSHESNTLNDLKRAEVDTSVEESMPPLSSVANVSASQRVRERAKPKWRWPVAAAISVLLCITTLSLLGTFMFKTPTGTIIVENLPADAEVLVDGKELEIAWNAGKDNAKVSIAAGDHNLEVSYQGNKIFSDKVSVKGSDQSIITLRLDNRRNIPQGDVTARFTPRRLSDVIDRTVAVTMLNDDFTTPEKSGFAFGGHKNKYRDGRYVVNGPYQGAWGNTAHRFTDFTCELVGRTTGAEHKGWGVAVFKKFDQGSLQVFKGFEVLLDSEGRLFVVPCRWVERKDKDIESIGPLQVASFRKGEFNSLVLILQKGTKLSVFVNEIEVCEEIALPYELIPANIQLATMGGNDQTSSLEFEMINVCSTIDKRAPNPRESTKSPSNLPMTELANPSVEKNEVHGVELAPVLLNVNSAEAAKLRAKTVQEARLADKTEAGKSLVQKLQQTRWPIDLLDRNTIPPEELLAAGGGDSKAVPAELVAVFGNSRTKSPCAKAAMSPDGNSVALTFPAVERLEIRSLFGALSEHVLKGDAKGIDGMCFSTDGQSLVTAGGVWQPKIWDVRDGEKASQFTNHDGYVTDLDVASDGARFCTCNSDTTARVWDIQSSNQLLVFRGHSKPIKSCRFSPDATKVITASNDGVVKVWDSKSGAEVLPALPIGKNGFAVAFRPFSDEIAVAEGNNITIHKLSSDAGPRSLVGHRATVLDLDYTLDGSKAVTSSRDGTIRIWNAETGEQEKLIRIHDGKGDITTARFTPEGRHVVIINGSGVCCVLRLAAEVLDEVNDVDHFAVGSVWSGTGSYSKGVREEEFTDNTWELKINGRDAENFVGQITYWGTMAQKRITLPVSGSGPKLGVGKVTINMPEKNKQFQNYVGEIKPEGTIQAKFTGEGAGGRRVEGTVDLSKRPVSHSR